MKYFPSKLPIPLVPSYFPRKKAENIKMMPDTKDNPVKTQKYEGNTVADKRKTSMPTRLAKKTLREVFLSRLRDILQVSQTGTGKLDVL